MMVLEEREAIYLEGRENCRAWGGKWRKGKIGRRAPQSPAQGSLPDCLSRIYIIRLNHWLPSGLDMANLSGSSEQPGNWKEADKRGSSSLSLFLGIHFF